jgi:hypothetical protein
VRAERNAVGDLLKPSPMSQKKEKKKRLPEQEKRKGTEQDMHSTKGHGTWLRRNLPWLSALPLPCNNTLILLDA